MYGVLILPAEVLQAPLLFNFQLSTVNLCGGSFSYPFSNFYASGSGEQMRPDDADKFAGVDDFGFLPELWEMALIAGDQVVRAGRICAFEENVIGGVGRDLKGTRGRDEMSPVFEELKKLLPESFANMEFRARQHGTVLREDRRRQVQPGRLSDGQKKNGALQTEGLERGRYKDIGIQD
jgi:hypothetical protein